MTGLLFLDWAIQSVSLFNVILLLWLGLTVLLNAEKRTWGIWLAAGGLLMGNIFFISHSVILGHQANAITAGQNFWWQVGLVPVMALPYAWYIVILWYTGYWEARQTVIPEEGDLYHRQRFWFLLTSCLALVQVVLLLFANPLSSFSRLVEQSLPDTLSIAGIPVAILVYTVYIVMSISLSVDALRRPGPTGRLMGNLARHRARRWLMAASCLLLLVSLLVGWVMVWIVENMEQSYITSAMVTTIGWFDLIIGTLIGLSVIVVGQAIVSYEVFTGKSLPRRGLTQYWQRAVILAAGYGVIVAWSLSIQLRPIYSLLLSTLLMTIFYALLAWRSYEDRNRFIENLRPFIGSQQLYKNILNGPGEKLTGDKQNDDEQEALGSSALIADISVSFRTLCAEVLETRLACLVPLGSMTTLTGQPLVYPQDIVFNKPPMDELVLQLSATRTTGVPLNADRYNGMVWAIPLWSERGLIGVLMLGEKRTGGLYAQEEIEIARAAGERLIDIQASAEVARRLVAIQRQRIVDSQVVDHQARRMIHDDILPLLQTAMLKITICNEHDKPIYSEVIALLGNAHHQLSDLLRAMPAGLAPEVIHAGLVGALRQAVEGDLRGLFDEVTFQIEPEAELAAQALPPLVAEVLYYAAREVIRNAGHHGRCPEVNRPLQLSMKITYHAGLNILIEDNGAGMPGAGVAEMGSYRADEQPSNHRSDFRGGQGLALHSTLMAVIGGMLAVDSLSGQYTRVVLSLPFAPFNP